MEPMTALETPKRVAPIARNIVTANPNRAAAAIPPMPRNPNVANVPAPVLGATGIIRAIPNLDVDTLRTGGAHGNDAARREESADQKLAVDCHTAAIRDEGEKRP